MKYRPHHDHRRSAARTLAMLLGFMLVGSCPASADGRGAAVHRLEAAVTAAVAKAVAPFGATQDEGNVIIEPNRPDSSYGAPDAAVDLIVPKFDCRGVETIGAALRAIADVLATPHGVAGVTYVGVKTYAADAGPAGVIDWRVVKTADLLRLRKGKAKVAHYLGAGERVYLAASLDPDGVVASCGQKLCAPEHEAVCSAPISKD